ncbi:MAG: EAL domain-containing protein [Acidimicrobiia bacterium]|nr:EAL domain-containing protein [Acidimicrobiia bacterium]
MTAGMAVVGALAAAFATTLDPLGDRPFVVPWWALAAAFALAEVFVIHLHVRRDAHTISLAELPFAFGLVFGSPVGLLAGRLVGAGSALVVHRRQAPTKIAFNMSLMALETGTGLMVFDAVAGGAAPPDPRAWVGLFAALVSSLAIGAGAVSVALAAVDRTRGFWQVSRSMGTGVFVGTATAIVSVIAVTVVWVEPWAGVPVGAVALMGGVAVRVYRSLNDRYEDLEAVYAFTRAVDEADGIEDLVAGALENVRDLMRADVAELVVGDTARRLTVEDRHPTTLDDTEHMPRPVGGEGVIVNTRGTLGTMHFGRPVAEAIAVPVPVGSTPGVLVVGRDASPSRVYDGDDVRLVEVLARQLGEAIEQEQLLSRLRDELAAKDFRASHDHLTGLPNRQFLADRIDRLLEEDHRFAVGVLDLDRFKEVNDTLGHQHGDALIAEVAGRLRDALDEGEVVARLGGDEFGLVLACGDGVVDALERSRALRRALGTPFTSEGFTFDVTGSIGIAMAPDDGTEAQVLLRRADVAMQEAKTSGSGYEVYDSRRDRSSTRRLVVAGELRTSITDETIEVHYQPKVHVGDLETVGVEALARWEHDRLGRVRPDEFVAVAEQTGLIGPLTELVMRTALGDLAKLHADGFEISMAVNVAARSLSDSGFPAMVAALTTEAGIDPRHLTLEVTETMIMTDSPRTTAVLSALDEIGVKLSIDDFGTGYSSLAYLTRLPVGELKIDRTFVGNMAVEHRNSRIVRSTTDMAHALDLQVVAEGVENRATLELLRAVRADVAQGYYFARPMPRDELVAWLVDGGAHRVVE